MGRGKRNPYVSHYIPLYTEAEGPGGNRQTKEKEMGAFTPIVVSGGGNGNAESKYPESRVLIIITGGEISSRSLTT